MRYFWIPIVILFQIGYAVLTKKLNTTHSLFNIIALYLYGALIQTWVLVSLVSKNLVLDALIFDVLSAAIFCFTMLILQAKPVTIIQIIGVLITIVGISMLK